MEKRDILNFKSMPELINKEEVFFSALIYKYNDKGRRQKRSFVLTSQAIYNFAKKKLKRRIAYNVLESISISTMSSEFVLHVKNSNDYRLRSFEYKNIIIENILRILCNVQKICTAFKMYYVPMINLDKIMTTHDYSKKKKYIRPGEKYQKIMNLEKYIDNSKEDTARQTEMRKRTTMLFTNKKKNMAKKEICLEDFELLKVLGRGAFGKVILCQKLDSKKYYAVKILSKQNIVETDQLEHTKAEKKILQHVNHPFLVNLEYAFQTPEKLYFVMEFMRGGELFQHLRKSKRFSEKRAKFYTACIVSGISFLHNKNYIYRDLKLENLLLDDKGYCKLTDFGLAKFIDKNDQANTFCGTPDYLSPEVILGRGHNRPADWWSLGILIYEMLYGIPPFYSSSNQKMYRRIIKEKVSFKKNPKISNEAKDLILKLLVKKADNRLGAKNGSLEIISHPWFNDIDFSKLNDMKLETPFKPEIDGENWLENFDSEFTQEEARDSEVNVDLNMLKQFQDEFEKMDFNIDNEEEGNES